MTVPIVPQPSNRLTYTLLGGTVSATLIVPSIVPHREGTVRGTVRGTVDA
jgi:hypothetical protein